MPALQEEYLLCLRLASCVSSCALHGCPAFVLLHRSSTEPAAQGCTALLQLKSATHEPALPQEDGVAITRAAAEDLAGHVQQLTQRERHASLTLLLIAMQVGGNCGPTNP
jgi:hypothetical protein